jgi:lipopolysaccharide transport system ATP-binding protein
MSEIVIKVDNLSKQYRLGKIGTGSFAHDVNRWWHRVRGKEDPYLKIGDANDRTKKGDSEYVWSLRDISFDIQKGAAVGVIGRNGAGKSTLLKILSRTTSPTTGSIKIKGRVASLLEVGTGFHPELTGRENIFLNGAILGMTKREIRNKFDEIVDFAGVERYIDTPVKRYSSGMYVRLAFGVAAHLEPEILIVDEVLAVGDAEFQRKALGKMKDVSEGEGRTVLFVSHNMAAIRSLCTQGIVLKNGQISHLGQIEDSLQHYSLSNSSIKGTNDFTPDESLPLEVMSLRVLNKDGLERDRIITGDRVLFELTYRNDTDEAIIPAIGFYDFVDNPVILCGGALKNKIFRKKGLNRIVLEIEKFPLLAGNYYLNLELKGSGTASRHIAKACKIFVENGDFYGTGVVPQWNKGVLIDFEWTEAQSVVN